LLRRHRRNRQSYPYYEQALAIEHKFGNREGEAIHLINLGNAYAALGQTTTSIDYFNQAIKIDREIENLEGLAQDLSNLGGSYAELGKPDEAMHYFQEALSIGQKIGSRYTEAAVLQNIGNVSLDQHKWEDAVQQLKRSIEIADDIGNLQYQKESRLGLAFAYLYQDQLKLSSEIALDAKRFNSPLSNPNNSALIGIVALLQGDAIKAKEAFDDTLRQIERLFTQSQQSYDALNIKALVLCGLTLCGDISYISEAKEVFKVARAVNSEEGIVHRVLQLFDALAKTDAKGILAEIRSIAAGRA
jgi:tetratricopeptide (TPR) repeat protein